jgi:hypothetical protein
VLPTQLEDELTKVRALAPPPPSDDPIYDYLTAVYRLRCKVASSAELQSALKAYHKAHSPRTLQQYAGVIIQMTAGDHISTNMKYKYVAALEFAFTKNVQSGTFKSIYQAARRFEQMRRITEEKTWSETSKKAAKETTMRSR